MKRRALNKYYNRSHISEDKFRELINCFYFDLNAYETSMMTNISHASCKKVYQKLRVHIFHHLLNEETSYKEFECDENYFKPSALEVNEAGVLLVKRLYSAYLKEMGMLMYRLLETVPEKS